MIFQPEEHYSVSIFRFPKTWRHYNENTTASSFSLYYTWCDGLRSHNCIILAIIIMMFIYSEIVVIWDPWFLIYHTLVSVVHKWHYRTTNQNPRASNDNNTLKTNIIVIFMNVSVRKWIKNMSAMRRCISGKWIKSTRSLKIKTSLVIKKKSNDDGRIG